MVSPERATNKGGAKISHFPQALNVNISKAVGDTAKVTINGKSHVGFRLTARSMTLHDLELL